MSKIKVLSVFGTRPEAIKMAPLMKELNKRTDEFENSIVITAQHREMLDQVLKSFELTPDHDLNIMKERQTLSSITSKTLLGLEGIIKTEKPDVVLVHGDTTTTMAASLAAFYNQVKIGHVEAGLRTWNKYSPYPEEMNRKITDSLADYYFAPTVQSRDNLLSENVLAEDIHVTGNTVIDALDYTVQRDYHHPVLDKITDENDFILVTMHRRENQGEPMKNVFKAIRKIIEEKPQVEIVFPVHLNPVVQEAAKQILGNHDRIHLIEPVDVFDFHNLAAKSHFIMTDSGGVQEEAPSLARPVLVLRDTTERPEGIDAGTLKLVGTDPDVVSLAMKSLLDNKDEYERMTKAKNPYGDGFASKRIADYLVYALGNKEERPVEFING